MYVLQQIVKSYNFILTNVRISFHLSVLVETETEEPGEPSQTVLLSDSYFTTIALVSSSDNTNKMDLHHHGLQ